MKNAYSQQGLSVKRHETRTEGALTQIYEADYLLHKDSGKVNYKVLELDWKSHSRNKHMTKVYLS